MDDWDAFSQNCPTKFKFYQSRVNRERKSCKMRKPTKDIVIMLLSNDSPSHDDKCRLASEINTAFLRPQQVYTPLLHANRLEWK